MWPATLKDFIALVGNRQLPPLPDALGRLLFTSRSNIARPALAQPIARPALALPDDISSAELLGGLKPRWSLEQAALEVESAQEGTRNDALNRMAYVAGLRIAAGELDVDSTYHRLTAAARIAGLDDDEIERTLNAAIDRGWRAGTLQSTAENKMTTWDRTPTRGIKSTFKNAILAVDALGVIARRDMFADKILLANAPGSNALAPDHLGSLADNVLAFLRKEIQQKIGFDPGADHLHSAITSLAEDARFNPVTDWLDGLAWDGVERLKSWLPSVTGAADTTLHRIVGRLLILGMLVRSRHPGTKFDTCLVLEGLQGSGKSTLVRLLCAGPGEGYFGDAPGLIGLEMKSRAELLSGKWVVELAELSGLARSEIENVKAFLSQTSDQFRPAYGRVAVSRPRSCVFVATTNSQTYLPDATGNRQFVPVACGAIDIPQLKRIRDQLFAEADALLRKAIEAAARPEF